MKLINPNNVKLGRFPSEHFRTFNEPPPKNWTLYIRKWDETDNGCLCLKNVNGVAEVITKENWRKLCK